MAVLGINGSRLEPYRVPLHVFSHSPEAKLPVRNVDPVYDLSAGGPM